MKEGWLGLMGGWYRSIAFSPVVLKPKEMSPFLQPGTSMYDWLDVNVTTYFCVSEIIRVLWFFNFVPK